MIMPILIGNTTTKLIIIFFRGSKPLKKALKALNRYYFEGLTDPRWPLKQIPSKQKFLRPSRSLKSKFQEPTWPSKQMFPVVEGERGGGGDMELASQEIYKVQIDCEWLVWLGWLVFNGCGYGVCGFFFPNCLKLFILF